MFASLASVKNKKITNRYNRKEKKVEDNTQGCVTADAGRSPQTLLMAT